MYYSVMAMYCMPLASRQNKSMNSSPSTQFMDHLRNRDALVGWVTFTVVRVTLPQHCVFMLKVLSVPLRWSESWVPTVAGTLLMVSRTVSSSLRNI